MLDVLLIGGPRDGDVVKIADFRYGSQPDGYMSVESWGGEARSGAVGRRVREGMWRVEVSFWESEFGEAPFASRERAFVSALAQRSHLAKPAKPGEDPFLIRVG